MPREPRYRAQRPFHSYTSYQGYRRRCRICGRRTHLTANHYTHMTATHFPPAPAPVVFVVVADIEYDIDADINEPAPVSG